MLIHAALAGETWWRTAGWPAPEEWSAFWAFMTFLVALLAAGAALVQLHQYIKEKRDQSRPYLVIDFEFKSVLLYVSVRNISRTAATNVTLTTNEPFRSTDMSREQVFAELFSPAYTISQLAPDREIRWLLDRTPEYFADKNLPRRYVVTAEYDSSQRAEPSRWRRDRGSRRLYTDTFTLDINQWGEASGETDYANKNWNIHSRNERVLKALSVNLRDIARNTERKPTPMPRIIRATRRSPNAYKRTDE
jgi:hypothetical protein